MNQFNWDQAFTLDFDLNNGLSKHADTTKRYLSQMKNMYQDQETVEEILKHEDPLIYEFYELGCPERAGDLAFGTTMIHPGKIGNEYYMTKGHFHQIVDTAEVYYTLKGEGYMMLENLDGDWRVERMEKGKALYVPRGYQDIYSFQWFQCLIFFKNLHLKIMIKSQRFIYHLSIQIVEFISVIFQITDNKAVNQTHYALDQLLHGSIIRYHLQMPCALYLCLCDITQKDHGIF